MTQYVWLLLFLVLLAVACIIAYSRSKLTTPEPTAEPPSKDCCPVCRNPFTVDDAYHEYPSDFGVVCKACFLEINKAWEEFTPDYDYYKMFYDVQFPDGSIEEHCWPNAGFMNAVNGSGKKFGPADKIKVRISRTHPMD